VSETGGDSIFASGGRNYPQMMYVYPQRKRQLVYIPNTSHSRTKSPNSTREASFLLSEVTHILTHSFLNVKFLFQARAGFSLDRLSKTKKKNREMKFVNVLGLLIGNRVDDRVDYQVDFRVDRVELVGCINTAKPNN